MDWNVELAELEALFDSQCGEDARTQNEDVENFDVSALHLDDVLARSDAPSALGRSPAPQQSTVQSSQQAAAQRTSEACKAERKRAQNRESQARHRQKAKVHSSRLLYMRCRRRTCRHVIRQIGYVLQPLGPSADGRRHLCMLCCSNRDSRRRRATPTRAAAPEAPPSGRSPSIQIPLLPKLSK